MTLITRLSTLGLHQGSVNDMTRLQSELGTIQQQIASGKTATNFKELSAKGQTERVLGFQNQLQRANDYIRNNTIITNRLQTYNSSISNIIDVAEQFRNLLVQRRTPTTSDALPFEALAKSFLATIQSNLNVEIEGRYIFSGSKTDTRPIDDISIPNYGTVNGERTFNTTYYKGDSIVLQTRASDALNMNYGITANDETFKNFIGAIHLALEGDVLKDDGLLTKASDMVSAAITELSKLQANISNNITILDQTNTEHIDFKNFLSQSLSDVTETDVGEASIRLSSVQTTLQASFLAYSKISSLRLSDYLT